MTSQKKNKEKPWIINLELTNLCNLSCVFCDYRNLKKGMVIKEMSDELIKKIFSDIEGEKIYELGLVGLGEPTLDRHLESHLNVINEHSDMFDRITFNSNMVSLGKKKAKILLNSKINAYTFSINTSNREAYLQMMGRDKFDLVIANLKTFLSLLKNQNYKPRVDIQILESNLNNIEEFKSLLAKEEYLKLNIFIRKVYSKPVIQESTELLNVHKAEQKSRYPCWDIYTRIYIDVEGNLYPCTIGNDSYRESSPLCLGNVFDNSVLDLFNSEKIQEARYKSEKGDIPFPECKMCNIWSLTPNNFEWDELRQAWKKKERQIRAYGLRV